MPHVQMVVVCHAAYKFSITYYLDLNHAKSTCICHFHFTLYSKNFYMSIFLFLVVVEGYGLLELVDCSFCSKNLFVTRGQLV